MVEEGKLLAILMTVMSVSLIACDEIPAIEEHGLKLQ